MIVRAALSKKRRDFAIAVALFCSSACTSLLGIDGEYSAGRTTASDTGLAAGGQTTGAGGMQSVLPLAAGGSGATRFDAGAAARGAGTSAGGTVTDASLGRPPAGSGGAAGFMVASGGTPGAGGVPASGGSVGAGTGAVPPDLDAATPVCPTGTFTGKYRGTHKPGNLLSSLGSPIAGDITLRFSATGSTSAMVTGGLLDPLTDTTGGVASTLRGTFDCKTRTGSASTVAPAEVTTLVPLVYIAPVEGSLAIKVDSAGTVAGAFTIHESNNTMGVGSGTWDASQ